LPAPKLGPDIRASTNLLFGCSILSTLPFRPDISFATATGHIICYRQIEMMELRRSYNLLMMKVLSLLQNKDQKLTSAIVASREAI